MPKPKFAIQFNSQYVTKYNQGYTMFYEKYLKATNEKGSFININLDPALPKQRSSNVVPDKYTSKEDAQALLDFSLDIIEQVSDYCCSIKPNTQYFLGHTEILKKIAKKTHDEGMLAILDHKLSDIGSTNGSAMFWIREMGFDAFTFSPFAGNTQKTVEKAHENNLGVIVLTLMSNPEAEKMMLDATVNGRPYYLHTAKTVKETQADGCVVGLTCFVEDKYIKNIQESVGDKVIFLLQGIGPQGGSANKIRYVTNPLVSLGRAVIYSDDPKDAVEQYHQIFKKYL
ncbi:MAG: orotidine 5'-phosphate decarboxylase [Candidatus Bathyarchaeota archaeon]|nr:orotidine 5'-phosphate decarboxylase [Candidatus Bathyarchaeum sp.]